MSHPQYSVIIGCGRLGSRLAGQLSRQGHGVVVVDSNETAFKALPPDFSGFQLLGNGAEFDVLHQAKIERADNLLAVTGEDNLNLMLAQVTQSLFQVERVLARVIDPSREAIYRKLGVVTVSPTPLVAQAFVEKLASLEPITPSPR